MKSEALTVSEKLLLSAFDLERRGQASFSAEDLVVRAWEQFPDTFGLAGFNDEHGLSRFPDANRVFVEIMGSKPIRKRGLLQKVGRKEYRLTESGRELARMLLPRTGLATQKAGLSRNARVSLRRLIASRAFQKFCDGREDAMTFYDACTFWGISPRSSAMELNARREDVRALIDAADNALGGEGEMTLEHGGEVLTRDRIERLKAVHEMMLQRFEEELNVISSRTDER